MTKSKNEENDTGDMSSNNTNNARPILKLRRPVVDTIELKQPNASKSKRPAELLKVAKVAKVEQAARVEQSKLEKPNEHKKPLKLILSKKKFYEILAYLKQQYPNSFSQPPKILALGIHIQLMQEEDKKSEENRLSKTTIRKFLQIYTRTASYRAVHQAGADRVDLFGNITGKVTEEEIAKVQKILLASNKADTN